MGTLYHLATMASRLLLTQVSYTQRAHTPLLIVEPVSRL